MMEVLQSLNLGDKLNPNKTPQISWCFVFLPALIAYFVLLSNLINEKPLTGSIEILHPSFASLIYPNTKMEIIAKDSIWTEGALWVEDESTSLGFLLYSDTQLNKMFRWDEGKGFFTVGRTLYVDKSGCKLDKEYCDTMFEPGSNGLLKMNSALMPIAERKNIDLLVCQHGERAISLIRENGTRTLMATHYKGKRFNSPNDLIWSPEGNLYFTDPRYGLWGKNDSEVGREIEFHGVYMIRKDDIRESLLTGEATANVILLDSEMSMPNGLAFSPDFSKLYVANSDPNNKYWKVSDVSPNTGALSNGRVFFDGNDLYEKEVKKGIFKENHGFPDGLKIDIHGNIFASGPGGVLVFSPSGNMIGRFNLDKPVSNIAFGGDGKLYFTNSDMIVRIRIKAKPIRIISSHFLKK
jgi:gluconolactonase